MKITFICGFYILTICFLAYPVHASPLLSNPYKGSLSPSAIQKFYAEREGELFWKQDTFTFNSNADDMIESLENIWQHGINPDNFRLNDIYALQKAESSEIRDTALDIVLTDAYIRYVRALSGMRVSASALNLDARDWLQPYSIAQTLEFLPRIKTFDNLGDQIVPKSQTYKRMQAELIELNRNPSELHMSTPRIPYIGRYLKPGQSHSAVPSVRAKLEIAPQTDNPNLYDDRLAGTIMKFQREHGLKPDGIIGGQTIHMLNQGPKERYEQLVANLERLRWRPHPGHDRFIMVNIPAAMLWAFEDGKTAFEMPVVVGRKKRETQPFITHITGVRINPDWTLPPTVKKEDIVPAVMEDPDYLKNRGIKVYASYGGDAEEIDTATYDWSAATEQDLKGLRMVQPPSTRNPLGQFRVIMPNKYNIYLHDTNNKAAFERATRGISSGCVRMSEPRKVVDFILERSQWTPEKIDSILEAGKKRDLMISEDIPVYLVYQSIWIDYQNRLVYGNDIYDRDQALLNLIKRLDGEIVPRHN